MPDGAMRRQPPGDLGEIDRPLALVNLHRIAAAERDVRPSFAGEMNEVALLAGAASRARLVGLDGSVVVAPHVIRQQGAADLVSRADY